MSGHLSRLPGALFGQTVRTDLLCATGGPLASELAFRDPADHAPAEASSRAGGDLTLKSQVCLVWSVVIAAAVVSGCRSVPDGPDNPEAVAPVVVTEGSGPAGDYRVWAFRTALGWTCIEVDSGNGSAGGCDPAGGPPIGVGVGRDDRGVVVHGITTEASAVSAVVRDANGLTTNLTLFDVGPTVPGAKIAVANLGPDAKPAAIDFLDADGSKVDSATFP